MPSENPKIHKMLEKLPISMCVIKQALLTGVEPESDGAFISHPIRIKYFTTGSFPETAAHQRGVTK